MSASSNADSLSDGCGTGSGVVDGVGCNCSSEGVGTSGSGVGGVGFFGGRSARVLWVGTGQDDKNLLQLHDDLEEQLASAGWPKDNRKFAGHLTLCRIRNSRAGMKLARLTEEYRNFNLGISTVDSITVYQSELTPKGPVYTSLGKYDLQ